MAASEEEDIRAVAYPLTHYLYATAAAERDAAKLKPVTSANLNTTKKWTKALSKDTSTHVSINVGKYKEDKHIVPL